MTASLVFLDNLHLFDVLIAKRRQKKKKIEIVMTSINKKYGFECSYFNFCFTAALFIHTV